MILVHIHMYMCTTRVYGGILATRIAMAGFGGQGQLQGKVMQPADRHKGGQH